MTDIDKHYIKKLIGTGATILDIGSFDGRDAVELAEICETIVHCFEPNPASYEIMKLLGNNSLIIYPYALCAFHGTVLLNLSNHPQSDTIKRPKMHLKVWPDIKYENTIQVKCTTLDSWNWHVRKGAPIDFCWVDINGAEGDFLIGAIETLKITKYLYIEFCVKELFAKALNKEAMIKALPGFECIGTYNEGLNYGNALFKNKNESLWQQPH